MQRDITEKLVLWKNKSDRKPLIIYGVRQVGKTWLMREFGGSHYKQTAYISFDNNERAKSVFNRDFDIGRIIRALSIETEVNINPADTLIIFDEIQECPGALTSLKYFHEDAPEYHIIAAGSLLGVISLEGTGFPVGKVDQLSLYPMTFLEFLKAVDNRYVQIIQNSDFPQLSVFHNAIIDLMQQYFFIGGMPAAVKNYAGTKNFSEVREIQNGILSSYYADFAKHIPSVTIAKVRTIWDSVPVQLAKENKRFLYSDMKQGSRGREYESALQWLKDTGLVKMLNRASLPRMPLIAYQELPIFKLYMPDIGLLSARTGLSPKAYVGSDTFTHYKGVLAEQFALQELLAANDVVPVYYWAADKNNAEIEFVIQYENEIVPVEVKSGKNVKSESLKLYKKLFSPKITIRTSLNEYSCNNGNYDIPLYMVASLYGFLSQVGL
ncbi:MAG: AAA family ATPase [Treponema sp.]|nr:AAA family ATPase [Treponema sp.]